MEFKHRAIDSAQRVTPLSSPLPVIASSSSLGVPSRRYLTGNSLSAPYSHLGDDFKWPECQPPTYFGVGQAMHHEILISQEMLRRRLLQEEIMRELEIERLMKLRSRSDALFPVQCIPRLTDESLLPSCLYHHPRMMDKGTMPPQDVDIHQQRSITDKVTSLMGDMDESPLPSYPIQCQRMADKGFMPRQDVEIAPQQVVTAKANMVSHTVFSAGTKKRKAGDVEGNHHITGPPQKGWSCQLCQVNVTSKEDLDEHFRGKKHKAKEAHLEIKKPMAKVNNCLVLPNKHSEPVAENKTASQLENKWSCSLCQVTFNSKGCLDGHLKGKKHRAKQATLRVTSKIEVDSDSEPNFLPEVVSELLPLKIGKKNTAKLLENQWSCSLCLITLNSKKCLDDHLKGKKHKVKEAKLKVDSKIEVDSDPSSLQKEDVKRFPVNEEKTISHGKEEPLQKDVKMDLDPEIEFWCEICKVKCSGEITFKHHTNGKKHKGQLKKFKPNSGNITSSGPACAVNNVTSGTKECRVGEDMTGLIMDEVDCMGIKAEDKLNGSKEADEGNSSTNSIIIEGALDRTAQLSG